MIYCLMLISLITTSLMSMDTPSSPCLIKEIIDTRIAPCMTLQEMSRLKRTCKGHGDAVDTENLLKKNNSYALRYLFDKFPYDTRTLILGHYGLTKNREMFAFLRDEEKELRDHDVLHCGVRGTSSLEYCMDLHATEYSTREKIQQVRVQQIQIVAFSDNRNFPEWASSFLKKILTGSGFNIWDVKIASSRKLLSLLTPKQETKRLRKDIVKAVCGLQDADLLLAIMGGVIEPRAMKYIFKWSKTLFIEALIEKGVFIKNVADKHNKTFYYYKWLYESEPLSGRGYRSGMIR